MRFLVHAVAEPGGWRIKVVPDGETVPVVPPRTLRALVHRSAGAVYPVAPAEELDALPTDDPAVALSLAADVEHIHRQYEDIATRQATKDTVESFGRYLFLTLLGEAAWDAMSERAGDVSIELALSWPRTERSLIRIPWEMMRSPTGYLAAQLHPAVTVARLVEGTRLTGEIVVQPRVLFVVGADLHDPQVRAGAEYMNLLRHLQSHPGTAGSSLMTEVVFRATGPAIRETMRRFRPSVVHFICHGGLDDDGDGYLQLFPDDGRGDPEPRGAEQLRSLLQLEPTSGSSVPNGLPPAIVLNACYTGALPPSDRPATPLAAELVEMGIPIAVGMWGRVADRACRAFTRYFYEALLRGRSVTQACALGRRKAFEGDADPRGVDWAFPTIFMAENAPTAVSLDAEEAERIGQTRAVALSFRKQNVPPVFCGRLDALAAYRELMHAPGTGPRVLAFKVTEPEVDELRMGKTRVLEELAATIVADGHIPCVVSFRPREDKPGTRRQFATRIVQAIGATRDRFPQLAQQVDYEWLNLMQHVENTDAAGDLSPRLQHQLLLHPPAGEVENLDVSVYSAALHADFEALAEEARRVYDRSDLRVVLLIDELHDFGLPALDLAAAMLRVESYVPTRRFFPVIVAFSAATRRAEHEATAKVLKEVEEAVGVKVVPLSRFAVPTKDRYPYEQLLLAHDPPLVVQQDPADPEMVDHLFQMIFDKSQGTPSRFWTGEVLTTIEAGFRFKVLTGASDEDLFEHEAQT